MNNYTIDSAVDRATGAAPTGAPIDDTPATTSPTIERGTHNPDNQMQGGPSMFHAVRGFVKAHTE